jgi:RecG-like helicase
MRVTTTNRTSKLQTATRTKTSSTTILNEQTGHLQNGTTIVSPTSLNNGTLRLIDSGDYLSTAVSPQQQQQQPVTTSTMLQYLQPSSNAIQNMLIQQILTSPEQQRLLVEKINQQLNEQIQLNLVQPTTTNATTTSNSDVIKQIQNQLANQQLLLQQVSSKQQQQQQQIPSLFSITNSNQPTTATVQYLTTTPTNSSTSGKNICLIFLCLENKKTRTLLSINIYVRVYRISIGDFNINTSLSSINNHQHCRFADHRSNELYWLVIPKNKKKYENFFLFPE